MLPAADPNLVIDDDNADAPARIVSAPVVIEDDAPETPPPGVIERPTSPTPVARANDVTTTGPRAVLRRGPA
jgi:hypothetical protein